MSAGITKSSLSSFQKGQKCVYTTLWVMISFQRYDSFSIDESLQVFFYSIFKCAIFFNFPKLQSSQLRSTTSCTLKRTTLTNLEFAKHGAYGYRRSIREGLFRLEWECPGSGRPYKLSSLLSFYFLVRLSKLSNVDPCLYYFRIYYSEHFDRRNKYCLINKDGVSI